MACHVVYYRHEGLSLVYLPHGQYLHYDLKLVINQHDLIWYVTKTFILKYGIYKVYSFCYTTWDISFKTWLKLNNNNKKIIAVLMVWNRAMRGLVNSNRIKIQYLAANVVYFFLHNTSNLKNDLQVARFILRSVETRCVHKRVLSLGFY